MKALIESQFLYLTTIGWRTGKQHTIEIWYVTHNEKYYIMSERGINAHWVRNIRKSYRFYEGKSISSANFRNYERKISLGSKTDRGTPTIKSDDSFIISYIFYEKLDNYDT